MSTQSPGLRLSPLGLGTAPFWRGLGSDTASALLYAALEEGITHIDTAPMYGLGHAERLIGGVLARRRDEFTIATKVGILPPPALASGVLPGRLLRGPLGVKQDFSLPAVRASFERSLRDLRTDHVDLLLLHECAPEHVTGELMGFLDECLDRGTARYVGTATSRAASATVSETWSPFPAVVQVPWEPRGQSGDRWTARLGRRIITHSSLRMVLEDVWRPLQNRPGEIQRWSGRLGVECAGSDVMAGLALALAQSDNPDGSTLFSSRSVARIKSNSRLAAAYHRDGDLMGGLHALVREALAGS